MLGSDEDRRFGTPGGRDMSLIVPLAIPVSVGIDPRIVRVIRVALDVDSAGWWILAWDDQRTTLGNIAWNLGVLCNSMSDKYRKSRNCESRKILGRMNRKKECSLARLRSSSSRSEGSGCSRSTGTPEKDRCLVFVSAADDDRLAIGNRDDAAERDRCVARRQQPGILASGRNRTSLERAELHIKF